MYPAIKMTDRTKLQLVKQQHLHTPLKLEPFLSPTVFVPKDWTSKECVYLNVFSLAVLLELFIRSFSDESLLRIMINCSCFFLQY